MNKQRRVLITITYNEMGIIIDTKAEEVAQPNLQPTCNQLATDCISRQTAIEAIHKEARLAGGSVAIEYADMFQEALLGLPSAQPEYTEQNVRDSFNSGYACGMEAAQPEIIRCKDCVLTDGYEPIADGRYWCMLHGAYMHYCSDAERRTDE